MFIVLTSATSGEIIVNFDNVTTIMSKPGTGGCNIYFIEVEDYINVNESIEEIFNKFEKRKEIYKNNTRRF